MSRVIINGHKIYLMTDEGLRFYYDESRKPLGAGSMGTVYMGHNYDTQEKVAIKRVKDKYSNISAIRERAKMEASLMFKHQNLVEMLGYCETSSNQGPIFIISSYVQGQTIDKFVNQHLRHYHDWAKRICEAVYPVFDALAYIHSKGIVHMDIKPSNIMQEQGKNVRLMDLGIVQMTTHSDMSGSSGLMGTPRYAAPEQFNYGTKLDARTDIYELGVTIYELLTRKNPFDSNNLEVMRKRHQDATVVLPYYQGVPKPVIDVLRIATNPDPTKRFDDVYAFRQALQSAFILKPKPWKWIIGGVILFMVIVSLILTFMLF
ncbi:MAG: serine/threonine protein kinase [Bacteroidaceae bacterium]|nr:serine/threonine protein kinase [Bacteroidaceae bacterium]